MSSIPVRAPKFFENIELADRDNLQPSPPSSSNDIRSRCIELINLYTGRPPMGEESTTAQNTYPLPMAYREAAAAAAVNNAKIELQQSRTPPLTASLGAVHSPSLKFFKPPKSYKRHVIWMSGLIIFLVLILSISLPVLGITAAKHARAKHAQNVTVSTTMHHTMMHTVTRVTSVTATSTPVNYNTCAHMVNDICAEENSPNLSIIAMSNCMALYKTFYCRMTADGATCKQMQPYCDSL